MPAFFQEPPQLGNQYACDELLVEYLRSTLSPEVLAAVEGDLTEMGEQAAGTLVDLQDAAEEQPPAHVPFDPWGCRVDEIRVSRAWNELRDVAVRAGLTALPYEDRLGPQARIVHAALCYLFAPASATYLCPVAMTDAAARTLIEHGDPEVVRPVVARLTTRDVADAWTSGQWMTEREGGSDVGAGSTRARLDNGEWRLYGTKWFASAATCDVALTLARPEGAAAGGRGLALFLCEVRRPDGSWNSIRVNRLKDKLGTRALPTAELELDGTPAIPVGAVEDSGVRKIATMLNLTRMHNAIAAVGGMRRGLALARSYAARRRAFGSTISDLPLHTETLAAIATEVEGGFALTFKVAELCGLVEAGEATEDDRRLLRILTPLAKLFTGKQAVSVASEVLEAFGGAGYIEDTGLPRLLRDAQVLPLWEGTTNVLSLDVLRSMAKDDAAKVLLAECGERLQRAHRYPPLTDVVQRVDQAASELNERLGSLAAADREVVEAGARKLALGLARLYAGVLLCEAAAAALDEGGQRARRRVAVARRWASTLQGTSYPDPEDVEAARSLARDLGP